MIEFRLHQFGVEHDLGIVGKELGDGAADLGVGGGFVEDFLAGAGNAGRGGQRDPRDGESALNLAQGNSRMGLNLRRRQPCAAQLRAQSL